MVESKQLVLNSISFEGRNFLLFPLSPSENFHQSYLSFMTSCACIFPQRGYINIEFTHEKSSLRPLATLSNSPSNTEVAD